MLFVGERAGGGKRSAGSMQPHTFAFQRAHSRTSGAIWRRACALWRTWIALLTDPYRPEQHYMRGPGPKSRERQNGGREGQKYCPKCNTMMVLERIAPKFGPLPELRTYKCLQCGCMVEEDIDR